MHSHTTCQLSTDGRPIDRQIYTCPNSSRTKQPISRQETATPETVDEYAQDVRCRLLYQAYPRAQQGTQETEDMGRSVLAYQFVAGLKPNLKSKLAGIECTFDQLLVKARFEEAKLRELSTVKPKTSSRDSPI